jgi:hypothetical protein
VRRQIKIPGAYGLICREDWGYGEQRKRIRAYKIQYGERIKIGNRCIENVAQFRYFGTMITDS